MSIAQRLRSIRIQKGLNQAEFGELLGTNGQSIADIETGKKKINLKILENLQVKMGIDLNWMITGSKAKYTENNQAGNLNEPTAQESKWMLEKMELLDENRKINNENRLLREKIDQLEGKEGKKGNGYAEPKAKLYK